MEVIICDDHPICRMGLELSLGKIWDKAPSCSHSHSGQDLIERLHDRLPDLLFLDLCLPDISALDLLREVRRLGPELAIIVVSGSEDPDLLKIAVKMKVTALLAKSHSLEKLKLALNQWSHGMKSIFVDPNLKTFVAPPPCSLPTLTHREWEVLEKIAQGKTNRDIAELLDCSVETIKSHRANLGYKLQARNRAELTAWYLKRKSHAHPSPLPRL